MAQHSQHNCLYRLRNIALGFAAGAGIGAGGAYAYFRRLQPTAAPQLTPAADLLPNQGPTTCVSGVVFGVRGSAVSCVCVSHIGARCLRVCVFCRSQAN